MPLPACKMPFIVSGKEVRSLVSVAEVISVVEEGLREFSSGRVVQPLRSKTLIPEKNGCLLVMPCYCHSLNVLATKFITWFPENDDVNVKRFHAEVFVLDPTTGTPLAVVDGESVTAIRTAAASAVALKYMRAPSPPKVLCIVGSGVQARSHIEALRVIHDFEEIRICSRSAARGAECASDVGGNNVKVFQDVEFACIDADVVVTVTMSRKPVLCGKWLKDHAIVIGVGACIANQRELDDDVVKNSLIVVDSKEVALRGSGDIILPKVEIYCEVGDLISKGPITTETAHSEGKKFLVFKSMGIPIEDGVTGKLVYKKKCTLQEKHSE